MAFGVLFYMPWRLIALLTAHIASFFGLSQPPVYDAIVVGCVPAIFLSSLLLFAQAFLPLDEQPVISQRESPQKHQEATC